MNKTISLLILLVALAPLSMRGQTCMPAITVHNGLSMNVQPLDTDGNGQTNLLGVRLNLGDLVVRVDNPCNSNPVTLAMRKSGFGIGMPTDTTLLFDCDEEGIQLVEVWARNADGVTNYTETYIIIQDNSWDCFDSPAPLSVCAPDLVAPFTTALNGLAGTFWSSGSGPVRFQAPASAFVSQTRDACGGPYEYRIRKAGWGAGPPADTAITFDCNEVGTNVVEIWTGDAAGNWSFVETYLRLRDLDGYCGFNPPNPLPRTCTPDKTPPYLLVRDGLAQSMVWGGLEASATFYVSDLVRMGFDRCSNPLQARISRADDSAALGDAPPADADTTIRFQCDELGTQPVLVWLGDAAGNWTKTETYVLIQDNSNACFLRPGQSATADPASKGYPIAGTARERNLSNGGGVSTLEVWPNPAEDGFTIRTRVDEDGVVGLRMYDAVGRLVRVLAEPVWTNAGEYQVYFPREGLPSGLYRCVWQGQSEIKTVGVVLR